MIVAVHVESPRLVGKVIFINISLDNYKSFFGASMLLPHFDSWRSKKKFSTQEMGPHEEHMNALLHFGFGIVFNFS